LLAGVNQEKEERKVKLAATPGQPDFAGVAHVIVPRQPPPVSVLERGDYRKPREVVSPAGLKAVALPSRDLGLGPDAPAGARRARALAARPPQPADRARLREPALALPLRPGPGRDAQRLRLQRRPAESSRAARLPRVAVRAERLGRQAHAPPDRHLGRLPASVAGAERRRAPRPRPGTAA